MRAQLFCIQDGIAHTDPQSTTTEDRNERSAEHQITENENPEPSAQNATEEAVFNHPPTDTSQHDTEEQTTSDGVQNNNITVGKSSQTPERPKVEWNESEIVRFAQHSTAGVDAQTEYNQRYEINDLEVAIQNYEAALDIEVPRQAWRAPIVKNLGTCLYIRYERKGIIQDLEKAVRCFR
ncbi:hypothetical protein FRC03_012838, partial [Tulasnella sp. 419]